MHIYYSNKELDCKIMDLSDQIHEILMNLNCGRIAVSQAHSDIMDLIQTKTIFDMKDQEKCSTN